MGLGRRPCFVVMPLVNLVKDVLFVSLCSLIYRIFRDRRRRLLPLPPGLPRWPILGNALSMPLTYAHVYYKRLGNKLGETIPKLSTNDWLICSSHRNQIHLCGGYGPTISNCQRLSCRTRSSRETISFLLEPVRETYIRIARNC